MTIEVVDNEAESRFEARIAEQLAIANYRLENGVMTFTHTEVPEEFQGEGIGGQLAHAALEKARAKGVKVRPLCPFIADYIKRNPEFQDLLEK